MEKKMSEIEQQLIQVNLKGSEGSLAFPVMLNEQFDTFSHAIDMGDSEPTKPQLETRSASEASQRECIGVRTMASSWS